MTKTTCFLAVAALMIGGFPAAAQADPPSKDELDFFESKIRPLLIEHCYECHSHESGESEGELFLDSAAGMRKGGISGATFKPGSPDKSLLMRSVLYKDRNLQMPPDSKLPREAIESLRSGSKWAHPIRERKRLPQKVPNRFRRYRVIRKHTGHSSHRNVLYRQRGVLPIHVIRLTTLLRSVPPKKASPTLGRQTALCLCVDCTLT